MPITSMRLCIRIILRSALLGVLPALGYGAGSGCATQSPPYFDDLHGEFVRSSAFVHAIYRNRHSNPDNTLHIYLDGDGTPWRGGAISADPSPRGQLVLEMVRRDTGPAMYVGRPCHFAVAIDAACHASVWTFSRYSEAVVASLGDQIRRQVQQRSATDVVLIGYSGGGVLAMLLAERVSNVRAVITMAAPLDIDAWSELHRYLPLSDSLNPARRAALPATIRQLHLAGARDTEVPPALIRRAVAHQPGAEVRELDSFDHRCCWLTLWPTLLDEVDR